MIKNFPCPCCRHLTLSEESPGSYEICPVCGWQDDIVQFENPARRGGANSVSLNEAQNNYLKTGAIDKIAANNVRPPKLDEIPTKPFKN